MQEKLPYLILAGGQGTRMRPLTDTTPKPLLSIFGKPLIAHTIDQARPYIDRVIIVVGYRHELFQEVLGTEYRGIPITYLHQESQDGTAHALQCAADLNLEQFYCSYGDDWYHEDCFAALASHSTGVVTVESDDWQRFAVVVADQDRQLTDFQEKPEHFVSNLVNTGLYRFSREIFAQYQKISPSSRGENEIPDMIMAHTQTTPYHVVTVSSDCWHPIGYPWNLLTFAENHQSLISSNTTHLDLPHVSIDGTVQIEEGAIIKPGTVIEGTVFIGSGTVIGPHAYLRGTTSIGRNCKIGASVEIKNSIIGDQTQIPHLSYVGDSVLGQGINVGAGSIIANLRHDHQPVKMKVQEKLTDTGRAKFGTVIGDNAQLGISTKVYPGRTIGSGGRTVPGQIVTKDIESTNQT